MKKNPLMLLPFSIALSGEIGCQEHLPLPGCHRWGLKTFLRRAWGQARPVRGLLWMTQVRGGEIGLGEEGTERGEI